MTMPARSQRPVAVVTGGNRGVGLEVCRQLAALGYAVVLGSRDPRRGELAAKEIDPEGERVTPCHIEVDNSVNVQRLGQWVRDGYGRVDAIVNNASAPPDLWAIAGNTDLSPVAEALDVTLFGAWRVTQTLLPLLRSSPRPRIVNVSSEGGSIELMNGGRPAYSVSKAALNALTRLLAGELRRDGILVNAVCPGWIPGDPGRGGASRGEGAARSYAQGAASVVWAVTLPNGGPTGTFTRDGRELPWLSALLRPGQRPAALREVGADPGDVGVQRRGVGDVGDRLLDRLPRRWVGGGRQIFGDEADFLVRELAAEEGKQRNVVAGGHAFRVAGPQPADDLVENGGECHGFTLPSRYACPRSLLRVADLVDLVDAPADGGEHDEEAERGDHHAGHAAADEHVGVAAAVGAGRRRPRPVRAERQRVKAPGEQGGQPGAGDQAEHEDLPQRAPVDPGHVRSPLALLRPRPAWRGP